MKMGNGYASPRPDPLRSQSRPGPGSNGPWNPCPRPIILASIVDIGADLDDPIEDIDALDTLDADTDDQDDPIEEDIDTLDIKQDLPQVPLLQKLQVFQAPPSAILSSLHP